jgi:hypothetical protein
MSRCEIQSGTLIDEVRMDKPHPARMYDYYLGGKDNFEADRDAAEQAMSVVPDGRQVAVANREFLVRAVEMMAGSGIGQFIDLGTGFPLALSARGTMRTCRSRLTKSACRRPSA